MNPDALLDQLKWNSDGLVPAIVQDSDSGEILMMAWMNRESLGLTFESKTTWFYSRSRQELWNKGGTSGNFQHVDRVLVDCDEDVLLVKVHVDGPACHTGQRSCFYRSIDG